MHLLLNDDDVVVKTKILNNNNNNNNNKKYYYYTSIFQTSVCISVSSGLTGLPGLPAYNKFLNDCRDTSIDIALKSQNLRVI